MAHPYWAEPVMEYEMKRRSDRRPVLCPYGDQMYIFREYVYYRKNATIINIIFGIGLHI